MFVQQLVAAATENDNRTQREIAQQWAVALAIFIAALWLYTRYNDFPFYYHPDEPSKVLQIRDGTRNFNHPLLLLTATDLAQRVSGAAADCQQLVELGRTWSALFAAAAAALFSWLGFNRFGVVGGIFVGFVMLIQRRLYEHAHFMKEDAALLFGLALTFVAFDLFWRRPGVARALFVGAAVGVAASGKYVGVIMLPLAVALLFMRQRASGGAWRSLLPLLVGFIAVAAVINYHALPEPSVVATGVSGEIERLNTRAGMKWSFSPVYWTRAFVELSPFLLIAFLLHLRFVARNFRSLAAPDLLLTAFPFLFGLMLSFSSKQSGRHTLPILLVSVVLASLAVIREAKLLQARGSVRASRWIALFVVGLLAYDIARTAVLDRSFQRDHRRELTAWLSANVPRQSIIGVDDRAGIPFGDRDRFCELSAPVPQAVRGASFVADLGTLDELRSRGFTHLVVSEARYYAVTNGQAKPSPPPNNLLERRTEFYRRLFNEGRLVWSRETGNVGVLNPGLRVYEIVPPAPARTP